MERGAASGVRGCAGCRSLGAGVSDQHLFDALAEMQQARAYNAARFGPSLYTPDCTDAFPRAVTIEFTESSAPLPAADTGSHA